MMSSIFSSFEAMGAESYGWKLVNFTPQKISPKSTTAKTTNSSSVVENKSNHNDNNNNGNNNNSSSVSGSVKKELMKNKKKNPRFAVELDGVHCFETIVPY